MPQPVVLYEDNHLLVVDKPPGMSSQGAAPGEPSLVDWSKEYLKRKYDKPGNVYLGIVSRLDRDVSGAIVMARTSKAAARLNEQFRERSVNKIYWAVVEGSPPQQLRCVDRLRIDDRAGRTVIAGAGDADAQDAALAFHVLQNLSGMTLVEVALETGRKHQIRVQLAERGWPIVGDKKYGSRRSFPAGIALHARKLEFTHPTRAETVTIDAACPPSWRNLGLSPGYFS
jgi:23S rRNA pseudouridine1911/1915/1917 synthase